MSRPASERARDRLIAALAPHAGPFGLVAASSREWASGLFFGARHRLAIALEGDDAAERVRRLECELSELELDLPGGFVAEIRVVSRFEGEMPVVAVGR